MGTMASQIIGKSIICSTVCSDTDQWKHQISASLALVRGGDRGISSQMASNAEINSIWWCYHEFSLLCSQWILRCSPWLCCTKKIKTAWHRIRRNTVTKFKECLQFTDVFMLHKDESSRGTGAHWIYMVDFSHYKLLCEITYPSPKFNSATVQDWF